jgi:ribosomal protein L23
MITHGKMKRVRQQIGKQTDRKKAFVKLAEGQKIEIK